MKISIWFHSTNLSIHPALLPYHPTRKTFLNETLWKNPIVILTVVLEYHAIPHRTLHLRMENPPKLYPVCQLNKPANFKSINRSPNEHERLIIRTQNTEVIDLLPALASYITTGTYVFVKPFQYPEHLVDNIST